jgi:curved DNA-binding protein CbpA
MWNQAESCPNCGAPLSSQGSCSNCGATARGYYQGLDLGSVDIARAVEEGLDYYLLLGVQPNADSTTIETAYWRIHKTLPSNRTRMPPELARRVTLVEQAGHVLRDQQRRQTYDHLRRVRQTQKARASADEATRGLACFRAGQFDDAARLLRVAARRDPQNETLHIQYALSLLYGSSNLASPEDWRVSEMLNALEQARESSGDSPTVRAHIALCQAVDAYDKGRFDEGWNQINSLITSLPKWYLPWIVSAYWRRREGNLPEVLARTEQARRLQQDDHLVNRLIGLMRQVWSARPDLLPNAAQRAAQLLADGTQPGVIVSVWR